MSERMKVIALVSALLIVFAILLVALTLAVTGHTLDTLPIMIGFSAPVITTLLTFYELDSKINHVKDSVDETTSVTEELKDTTNTLSEQIVEMQTGPIPLMQRPPLPPHTPIRETPLEAG